MHTNITPNSTPQAGDSAFQVSSPSSTKSPLRSYRRKLGIWHSTTAPNSHR